MAPLLSGSRTDRAFERLYKRHVGDVYRYSLAVLRSTADAEDVTQTTFLNAYRAFQRGERPQKPNNWLIRIAHNVCRQRFRQAARRPQEVSFDEDVAEMIAPDVDAWTAADIQRALSQLAFNQRSALVLRELEGRSYAEIADALGTTVSAVETLLFRARRALREQLEGALTCREAELAVSRQLDRRLPRSQRGPLRAHLRGCAECARFARSQRAQRSAWKALSLVPVPASLASFFGGGGGAAVTAGGAGVGAVVVAKTAALVAGGVLVAGASYEAVEHPPWRASAPKVARAVVVPPTPRRAPVRRTPPPALESEPAVPEPIAKRTATKPKPKVERPVRRALGREKKAKAKVRHAGKVRPVRAQDTGRGVGRTKPSKAAKQEAIRSAQAERRPAHGRPAAPPGQRGKGRGKHKK